MLPLENFSYAMLFVIIDITLIVFLLNFVGYTVNKNYPTRALDFLLVVIFSVASSEGIKFLIDKPRPSLTMLNRVFEGSSFPSTHTTVAIAIAFFYLFIFLEIERKNKNLRISTSISHSEGLKIFFIFTASILVAVLRVVVGAHEIVDVLTGAFLGFLIAVIFKYLDFNVEKVKY